VVRDASIPLLLVLVLVLVLEDCCGDLLGKPLGLMEPPLGVGRKSKIKTTNTD
jgi:hypothetical protein